MQQLEYFTTVFIDRLGYKHAHAPEHLVYQILDYVITELFWQTAGNYLVSLNHLLLQTEKIIRQDLDQSRVHEDELELLSLQKSAEICILVVLVVP